MSAPPGCSVTATVLKDRADGSAVKGAMAKRQRKGLAGPDLSTREEVGRKQIAVCESTMAFFSSDDEEPGSSPSTWPGRW